MNKQELYLALDFDGVLHSTQMGPTRKHCADYAAGRLSAAQFLQQVTKVNRARYDLTSEHVDFLFDRAAFLSSAFWGLGLFEVRLVIATSWRNAMSPHALRALLPALLDRHVVGVLETHEDEHRESGTRARLMRKWMAEHAPKARWLAIDDDCRLWDGEHSRLIQTPRTGLDCPCWSELRDVCSSVAAGNGRFDWKFEEALQANS